MRLYRDGLSLSAIAGRLGMTAEGVRLILVRIGVPRRPAGGQKGGPAGG